MAFSFEPLLALSAGHIMAVSAGPEHFRVINDHSFFISCILHVKRMMVINRHIVYYRTKQQESLIGTKYKHYQCQINSYNLIREMVKELPSKQKQLIMQYELRGVLGWYKGLRPQAIPPFDKQLDMQLSAFVNSFNIDDTGTKYLYTMANRYDFFQIKKEINESKHVPETQGSCVSTPKVSIIIPVYNAAQYLHQCLDSVINQTLVDIELICINDGSSDNSLEILEEYSTKDQRIRVLSQTNAGAGAARNTGLFLAKGEYIAFMDADDYYPNNSVLNQLYSEAKKHSVFICGGSLCTVRNNMVNTNFDMDSYWGYTFPVDMLMYYKDYQFDYGFSRFIYQRNFLINNGIIFPSYRTFEDPPFFTNAMAKAKVFYAVSNITYCYRESNHYSAIMTDKRKLCDCISGFIDVLNIAKKYNLHELYCLSVERCCIKNKAIVNATEQAFEEETDKALMNLRSSLDLHYWEPSLDLTVETRKKIQFIRENAVNNTSINPSLPKNNSSSPVVQYHVRENRKYPNSTIRPNISIIIPVFNARQYLSECLNSVVNQTTDLIEIVCIDDGSTDDGLLILEDFQSNDPRITVISQPNRGLSAARNIGLQYSRGDYIQFLDSDDFLDLNALEKTSLLANENELDVVAFGFEPFYENEELSQTVSFNYDKVKDAIDVIAGVDFLKVTKDSGGFMTSACRATWRRKLLEDNNICFVEGIIHEDNLFSFLAYIMAKRVMQIPDKLYKRRIRENSIMTVAKTHRNVVGYFTCAIGVLEYAYRDKYEPKEEREIRRSFYEMITEAKRDYVSLSQEERQKISFPKDIDNLLFQRIIVNEVKTQDLQLKTDSTIIELNLKMEHEREIMRYYQQEVELIHASWTYRIGRFITFIPRKVRGGYRCLKENGLRYTFRRTLEHLGLK